MGYQMLRTNETGTLLPQGHGTAVAPSTHEVQSADILATLGFAAFSWALDEDALAWSANAETLFRSAGLSVPTTGRALQRLLTVETAGFRAEAVPPLSGIEVATERHFRVTYALRGPTGDPVWVEETSHWQPPGPGARSGRIDGVIRQIEAPRSVAVNGHAVSLTTGLMLRDGLLGSFDDVLGRLKRERQGSATLMVIAVDDVGRINANFGYDVGDHVIATVANRIARRMRGGDVLGHLSGHKFGAILNNCTESTIDFVAERFRSAIADEPVVTAEAEIPVRISIGAVVVPRHAGNADTAAIRAEEALFETRSRGGDGITVYSPSPERDLARRRNMEMAEEIIRGLAEGRFVLAYQPVVEAGTGRILYFEALSRLIRRDHTVISAGSLIATAEKLGLVSRIDRRTLELALADLAANHDLRLSINASVATVSDDQWLGQLVDGLGADRSIAGRLTIEITETSAMLDMASMRHASQTLRDIGCKVAIDDFGAGHTSLKSLRDLHIDWVKIDGSYITDVCTNPDSAVFVQMLVGLANHFSIGTVAEWVPDGAAAERLRSLGVRGLQGRHTGMPKLRITPELAVTLGDLKNLIVTRETDGYPCFDGLLTGPIATR